MTDNINKFVWLFRCCSVVVISLLLSYVFVAQDMKSGTVFTWTKGNPKSPVTIEAFNDYQCSSSKTFNDELKKIEIEYKDRVRIIFRNYPLIGTHKFALEAAQAAEAAGMQGKFFEMVDTLYGRQQQWGISGDIKDVFTAYARELGLDIERFFRDMRSKQVRKQISLDLERGKSLKVEGTPTILVNGKDIGPPTLKLLRDAIEESLRATSTQPQPNTSSLR